MLDEKEMCLHLGLASEKEILETEKVLKALGNSIRLHILRLVWQKNLRISELGKILGMSNSTVLFHVDCLKDAGLVCVDYEPSQKGFAQFVYGTRFLHSIRLDFITLPPRPQWKQFVCEVPVGQYVDAHTDKCFSIATERKFFGIQSSDMFLPQRGEAELLWLYPSGHLTYAFPCSELRKEVESIVFSFEICSEAPMSKMGWKSDVTFSVNGIELCTYTCPHDYGDRPGLLNPEWWGRGNTQHGDLITVAVDDKGVTLNQDGIPHSPTLMDLHLATSDKLDFKFEVKPNATHVGGLNLFGKKFGDYAQDIRMTVNLK